MAERSVESAWTHYWHSDRLASCGGAGGRQYQPAIVRHWHRVFAALEPPHHLLDLCCGNGALAILAGHYFWASHGLEAEIDAVDRAAIDPGRWLTQHRAWVSKIRFQGNTAAESLPFPDAMFTAVIGQYALEYTDLTRSLPECVRVLAPRGHLAFVLHAREGSVAARALAQQTEIARIQALNYFHRARELAQAAGVGAPPSVLGPLRQAFEIEQEALRALARDASEPDMYENILGVTEHALEHVRDCPVELIVAKISEVEAGLHFHALRTGALIHAALDARGIREHLAPLFTQGFKPVGECPAALRGPMGLLGWSVVLTRS